MTVTIDDIRAAAAVLEGRVLDTPCLHSRTLSEITGAQVYLKFENHQFTASFKERGALNKLASLDPAAAAKGVIACSAGNHAQGVAYHASRLGIPAVIVMPRYTPFVKVEHRRKHGAEVILHGENFDDAREHALGLERSPDLTLVHPYHDEKVIAGQGTMIPGTPWMMRIHRIHVIRVTWPIPRRSLKAPSAGSVESHGLGRLL